MTRRGRRLSPRAAPSRFRWVQRWSPFDLRPVGIALAFLTGLAFLAVGPLLAQSGIGKPASQNSDSPDARAPMSVKSKVRTDLWLSDLDSLREAVEQRYPNLDWLLHERGAPLDFWFAQTANLLRRSENDNEARKAVEHLLSLFRDGHVRIEWPETASMTLPTERPSAAPEQVADSPHLCASLGYDSGQVSEGIASAFPGYESLAVDGPFEAGTLAISDKTVGIIRIGAFSPHGYPSVCKQYLAREQIGSDQSCDLVCEERLLDASFQIITRALADVTTALKANGADVLLIDISQNGGGSEWAEAAARIVSPVSLRSAPLVVVKGHAWAERWRDLANDLKSQAAMASLKDRRLLKEYAARAQAIAGGLAPCRDAVCSRTAPAGFASGIIAEARAEDFAGRPWAFKVFSPARYPYHDKVWTGPLIVLVDQQTWSAAEQFAALLQDNSAAVVLGTKTGGAGCGSLFGREPVQLKHSGGLLWLPNCARLRKDGSNEVAGIIPDVRLEAGSNYDLATAAWLAFAKLGEAIEAAEQLLARGDPEPAS